MLSIEIVAHSIEIVNLSSIDNRNDTKRQTAEKGDQNRPDQMIIGLGRTLPLHIVGLIILLVGLLIGLLIGRLLVLWLLIRRLLILWLLLVGLLILIIHNGE